VQVCEDAAPAGEARGAEVAQLREGRARGALREEAPEAGDGDQAGTAGEAGEGLVELVTRLERARRGGGGGGGGGGGSGARGGGGARGDRRGKVARSTHLEARRARWSSPGRGCELGVEFCQHPGRGHWFARFLSVTNGRFASFTRVIGAKGTVVT
jgi:hypothetical protein